MIGRPESRGIWPRQSPLGVWESRGFGPNPASPTTRWPRVVSSHSKSHYGRTIRSGVLSISRRGSQDDNHALAWAVSLKLARRHMSRDWRGSCRAFWTDSRPCVSRIMTSAMSKCLPTVSAVNPNLPPTRSKEAPWSYMARISRISLLDGEWLRRTTPRSRRRRESRSRPRPTCRATAFRDPPASQAASAR